jgi:eukaryotic-like serine/threonine-protein kinase
MLGSTGKYRLDQRLGGGGMAEVFLGSTQGAEGFSRKVAIKRVLPGFSDNPSFAQMFVSEAQISAQLQHPNIVSVLDFDRDAENRLFLVMELVEGRDLDTLVQTGVLPWAVTIFVISEVLRGLGHAHDLPVGGAIRGIVHRDVSPHNVLLGINGVVKISDFGLAKARDRIASLTAPGTVKGKLSYLAPEVSFGKPNTAQSDLFGVGSVIWEALSGERLFDGKTDVEIFKKIRACKVPPILERRSDVPPALAAVLDVALSAEPANRYATAVEFASALSQVMKQAVGIDAATALGTAVAEARLRDRSKAGDDFAPTLPAGPRAKRESVDVEFSTAEANVEPIELTKKK